MVVYPKEPSQIHKCHSPLMQEVKSHGNILIIFVWVIYIYVCSSPRFFSRDGEFANVSFLELVGSWDWSCFEPRKLLPPQKESSNPHPRNRYSSLVGSVRTVPVGGGMVFLNRGWDLILLTFFSVKMSHKNGWQVAGGNNDTVGFLFGGVEMDNFWLRLWLLLLPTGSEFEIHGKLMGRDQGTLVVLSCCACLFGKYQDGQHETFRRFRLAYHV